MGIGGDILKVNILGTEYEILHKKTSEEPRLEEADGICDTSVKQITIGIFERDLMSVKDLDYYEKKVIRHEIIHAFLCESGLWSNSGNIKNWAISEEITDWIALQFPKILKAFQKADCL